MKFASYPMSSLKGDLSGGLVAGVIALPLALAFGVQSGLGAAAGLYGAIALGVLAAALGGTRTQASGPTGPMTVVSASIVAVAIEQTGSLQSAMGLILLAFLAGGVFQIILGLLGVGRYVKYFPYPVISGFMSGVGLIIVALQIWPFFGSSSPKSTLAVFTGIAEPLANVNVNAVLLGLLTVAIYYLFPKITRKIPSVLVALLVGTGVAAVANLAVPTIGDIPSGIPSLQIGELLSVAPEHYTLIIGFGLTLALLGAIDSLLTSVIADNITKTKHDSRRELIGQGIGNMVAALFGGLPGAGATKGTVVNINAGGTTRLSGVVHGLFLLAVLLGLGQFASAIPLSVLAGLLIPVGLAIIDYKGLKHLRHVPRADAAVLVLVLLMTVFGNLIHAVGLGVVLACVLFMKKTGDLAEQNTSVERHETDVWQDETGLNATAGRKIYIKHLYGSLFFGSSAGFQDLMAALDNDTRILVIRMERVPYVDQSGLYALENAALDLRRKGAMLMMTGVQTQPLDMMRRIKLVPELVPEEYLFQDMAQFKRWLADSGTQSPSAEPPAAAVVPVAV